MTKARKELLGKLLKQYKEEKKRCINVIKLKKLLSQGKEVYSKLSKDHSFVNIQRVSDSKIAINVDVQGLDQAGIFVTDLFSNKCKKIIDYFSTVFNVKGLSVTSMDSRRSITMGQHYGKHIVIQGNNQQLTDAQLKEFGAYITQYVSEYIDSL